MQTRVGTPALDERDRRAQKLRFRSQKRERRKRALESEPPLVSRSRMGVMDSIRKERPILLSDVLCGEDLFPDLPSSYKKLLRVSSETGFRVTTLRNWVSGRFFPRLNIEVLSALLYYFGVDFDCFVEALQNSRKVQNLRPFDPNRRAKHPPLSQAFVDRLETERQKLKE
jgi:hypothetical protein